MHAAADNAIWLLALLFTLYAGYVDGRTHRIPNWLTVLGFSAGLAVHSLFNGLRGRNHFSGRGPAGVGDLASLRLA